MPCIDIENGSLEIREVVGAAWFEPHPVLGHGFELIAACARVGVPVGARPVNLQLAIAVWIGARELGSGDVDIFVHGQLVPTSRAIQPPARIRRRMVHRDARSRSHNPRRPVKLSRLRVKPTAVPRCVRRFTSRLMHYALPRQHPASSARDQRYTARSGCFLNSAAGHRASSATTRWRCRSAEESRAFAISSGIANVSATSPVGAVTEIGQQQNVLFLRTKLTQGPADAIGPALTRDYFTANAVRRSGNRGAPRQPTPYEMRPSALGSGRLLDRAQSVAAPS